MGADNWAICPKCLKNREAEATDAMEKAEAAYGKVSSKKYAELLSIATAAPGETENSLREDYEIGVNQLGNFYVVYSCSCTRCGFDFKFKSEKNILKE